MAMLGSELWKTIIYCDISSIKSKNDDVDDDDDLKLVTILAALPIFSYCNRCVLKWISTFSFVNRNGNGENDVNF